LQSPCEAAHDMTDECLVLPSCIISESLPGTYDKAH
jgi:hypothetical protein